MSKLDQLLKAARDGDLIHRQEALGNLAILLGNLARQQDRPGLRSALREIALNVSDKDARWLIQSARSHLSPEQGIWMSDAIAQIQSGADDE